MDDDLELRPEGGGPSLFLFSLNFADQYFEALAYNAVRNTPEGTVYRATTPDGVTFRLRSEQAIKKGLYFFPGNEEHFGRLDESVLFKLLGVVE